MKEGASVFAPVGKSFSGPSWRQALIIQKLDAERWLLVVRMESSTTGQEGSFELEGRTFIVVEGSTPSMRKACADPFLALEVDIAALRRAATEFLNSHQDLVFTTASEEAAPATGPVGPLPAKKRPSKVETDSDSSEGEVDLLDDVRKLQKSWRGRGTNDDEDDSSSEVEVPVKLLKKDKTKKQKKRYALLEPKGQRVSRKTVDVDDGLLQKLASGSNTNPLQTLATMEVLKRLRGSGRKKSKESSSSSSSRQRSDSSSSDSHRGHKATGVAKAVGNFRRWKRSLKKHPTRHVRRYVKQVEHDLGVTDGLPYRLTDHGKKITWNRHKSLQKVYYLLGAILEKQLRGEPEQAAMLTVQSLRAVHQVVIDEGNWSLAWLLTGLDDPFSRRKFGGEEESLETIAAFLKASQDLERRTKTWNLNADSTEQEFKGRVTDGAEGDPKGRPKGGRGKGKNSDPPKADA